MVDAKVLAARPVTNVAQNSLQGYSARLELHGRK